MVPGVTFRRNETSLRLESQWRRWASRAALVAHSIALRDRGGCRSKRMGKRNCYKGPNVLSTTVQRSCTRLTDSLNHALYDQREGGGAASALTGSGPWMPTHRVKVRTPNQDAALAGLRCWSRESRS
jgi:hypothetical protein